MSARETINAFYADLYAGQPDIKPAAAAAELVAACPDLLDGEEVEDVLRHEGAQRLYMAWKKPLRKAANDAVNRALVSGTVDAPVIAVWMQSPIPGAVDPDRAPRIADCTLLMLGESVAQLRRQVHTLGSQVARLSRLMGQLAAAIDRAGDPDLTAGQAFARGLLDADALAAA